MSRWPRRIIACRAGKICLYARSPVVPKKTSASEREAVIRHLLWGRQPFPRGRRTRNAWFSFLLQDRHARFTQASDVGQLAEVLMVLVVAAFPLVDRLDVLDKLDRLDPLDHLEAELILDTQPQWCP